MVAGQNTAANEIIALAGGVNAIDGYDGYKIINDEAIVAAKPGRGARRSSAARIRWTRRRCIVHPAFALTPVAAQQDLHLHGRPLSARLRTAHGGRRARSLDQALSGAGAAGREVHARRPSPPTAGYDRPLRQRGSVRKPRSGYALRPPGFAHPRLPADRACRRGADRADDGRRRHSAGAAAGRARAVAATPVRRWRATSSCCGRSGFRGSPRPRWSAPCSPHPAPSCRGCFAIRWPIPRWSAFPPAARSRRPSAIVVHRQPDRPKLPLHAASIAAARGVCRARWSTTVVLYSIASRSGRTSIAIFLLAGIAIAAIANAGIGLLVFIADDRQLRDITFWMLGSLSGATWPKLATLAPVLALALDRLRLRSRAGSTCWCWARPRRFTAASTSSG